MTNTIKYRIESIDLLRGMVMILMALDHARMYFGHGTFFAEPTDLSITTPFLFFTRWITHFCAPVFVFLAGTSAYLSGTRRKSIKEVSRFLFTRGIWLVLIEVIIVRFGWTFDITFSTIILQVIWVIGLSMVFLSALVFLPKWLIFAISVIIVFGHNVFDSIVGAGYYEIISTTGITLKSFIYCVLHQPNFMVLGPNFVIQVVYPLIPWLGLMPLGYLFGTLYQKEFSPEKRKKYLLWIGLGAIALFLFLRTFNIYGDPAHWAPQESFAFSVMSFFNVTKYPVSLLFILITIGPSLIFLYLTENVRNKTTGYIIIYGRVPFFFYIIHIYFIHLLGFLGLLYVGRNPGEFILTARSFMAATLANHGFSLYVTYAVWIIVIVLMFPLCRWYNKYKSENRDKSWLSYL